MALKLRGGFFFPKQNIEFLQRITGGHSMSKLKKQSSEEPLATKLMPLYCFEVLDHALQNKGHPKFPEDLGTDPSYVQ